MTDHIDEGEAVLTIFVACLFAQVVFGFDSVWGVISAVGTFGLLKILFGLLQ